MGSISRSIPFCSDDRGSMCFLELYPRRSPMGVCKPIVPLNCISFEVDDSGVHHGILRCLILKIGYDGYILRLGRWLKERTIMLKVFPDDDYRSTAYDRTKIESL
ncbi:hypothetical protein B296_00027674 [Ensete ventricosum]|uniref:Uncharacterized protein n=1 Tax=Ensete ventricosum TaxID=4639 RepID=A0A426XT21_ENSVE|nr:hypothetical protein B296_00027674 [Ensete ventricosum]